MMAAIVICGAVVFTSCSSDSDDSWKLDAGIAMIVKNGKIDYWRQVETTFRKSCEEKGLKAYYYATSAENAYREQLAAVEELRKLDSNVLKGIIFTPSYGPDGESAEAEVAALAKERGIPVVILDSPVSADSPLASYPYFGTDNTAAGKEMADKVATDNIAVFAMTNSPGIERAKAFKELKPNAVIYEVGDKAITEVGQAILADYDEFVFFNGNDLVDVLSMLKLANKDIYTFDVYPEFLDELIAGNSNLKCIMAQNTFAMASKAVDAVLANAKQGAIVPTTYIDSYNLEAPNVQPYLAFYDKKVPVIENLAEKLLGKWIDSEEDGQPMLTSDKSVVTFVSSTKAIYSTSKTDFSETRVKWSAHREYEAKISGNKVTLTGHPEGNPKITLQEEYIITAITATEIVCKNKHTTIHEGQGESSVTEKNIRMKKIDVDYRTDIIGLWECKSLSGGETYNDGNARLEFFDDGTYNFYRKNDDGQWEIVITREFQKYFVDGTLLATRWENQGDDEHRESWDINSLKDNKMQWRSLREKEDGTTFEQIAEWERVESE